MKKRALLIGVTVCLAVVLTGLLAGLLLWPGRQEPLPAETTVPATAETAATTLPDPPPNVFTPMDFEYDGQYLTCLTQESILGVDVSSYQKEVDWQKVKDAGVEFAMIRAGFRGYGEAGSLVEDPYAQANYENAKAAGLKIGAYFFSQAITEEEAREEAEFAMEIIADWELDMPLVYDWECLSNDYRTVVVGTPTLTRLVKAFCEAVREGGYEPMIYFNPNQSYTAVYLEELTEYRFWLAMYSDEMDYKYKVDMWQYTNTGTVPGIEGPADLNLYFPYEE